MKRSHSLELEFVVVERNETFALLRRTPRKSDREDVPGTVGRRIPERANGISMGFSSGVQERSKDKGFRERDDGFNGTERKKKQSRVATCTAHSALREWCGSPASGAHNAFYSGTDSKVI